MTTGKESKMGFFDLARELRDEIYDLALEHDRTTPIDHRQPSTSDQGTLQLHVRAPEPRLRLVSRQFASEYYERSPSADDICLSVTGRSPKTSLQSPPGFPYAARASIVDVTLTFVDSCEDTIYRYIFHPLVSWLCELVAGMPCIKTLRPHLYFTVPLNPRMIKRFSRSARRGIPRVAPAFERLQKKSNDGPAITIDKLNVMLVTPVVDPNDVGSTANEPRWVGSWTLLDGYRAEVGLVELRRKYHGS